MFFSLCLFVRTTSLMYVHIMFVYLFLSSGCRSRSQNSRSIQGDRRSEDDGGRWRPGEAPALHEQLGRGHLGARSCRARHKYNGPRARGGQREYHQPVAAAVPPVVAG